MKLPDLPAGVYRHYKGHLYQTLGYGRLEADGSIAVIYFGLQLQDAHKGSPRLNVRPALSNDPTVDAWWDFVHPDGIKCTHDRHETQCSNGQTIKPWFEYINPLWEDKA